MDRIINELLKGRKSCHCGLKHECSIDNVIIEKNAINKIPSLLNGYRYKNIVLVADNNTYKVCGQRIYKLLVSSDFNVVNLVYQRDDLLIPNEEAIEELSNEVSADTDVIIGIGSGVINDLCKYVSFKMNLPYIIVATAPSMDGYASVGAAMIIKNMKITYNAHVPKAIISDTDILKEAPMDLIRAGFGDMVGKLSALNDWKLSNIITDEVICDEVYDLVMNAVRICIYDADGIANLYEESVKRLMEGLVIVGIAKSYMGNSRPASGSEHHLSHFYEVINIMKGKPYFLHGIDVAFSTVVTCALRHKLASSEPIDFEYSFDGEQWEKNIYNIYGEAAEGVISLQKRLGLYSNKNFKKITDNWDKIREVLCEVPSYLDIVELIKIVGLNMKSFYDMYDEEMIINSILYAKDLKDRYTLFWLLQDVGLLERASDGFAKDIL
ncbi:MAG: sn-glycerol-1-phosphate dehydrogenase [Clostridiales bacterium]|nr:sn-glycerol-1-phosphate dehydrogenase [Clostridiales bacterium]